MRCLWADKLVRICGGFALLLLLAAEEKVCPWLLTPPAPVESECRDGRAVADHSESTPGEEGESPQQPVPLSLSAVLPDAIPARWPSIPARGSLDETTGWRSGTHAQGPRDITNGRANWPADAHTPWPSWRWALRAPATVGVVRPSTGLLRIVDPAIDSVLLRTGPPHA